MALLAFALGLLVVLGNFVDFLLGKAGRTATKGRLLNAYMAVNVGSWRGLTGVAARLVGDYIAAALLARRGAAHSCSGSPG